MDGPAVILPILAVVLVVVVVVLLVWKIASVYWSNKEVERLERELDTQEFIVDNPIYIDPIKKRPRTEPQSRIKSQYEMVSPDGDSIVDV